VAGVEYFPRSYVEGDFEIVCSKKLKKIYSFLEGDAWNFIRYI
jgi:hypothetical protein